MAKILLERQKSTSYKIKTQNQAPFDKIVFNFSNLSFKKFRAHDQHLELIYENH